MTTFIKEIAGWVRRHHRVEASHILEDALAHEVERARKPTRDAVAKRAVLNAAETIAIRFLRGPQFRDWLGDWFQRIGNHASREGVLPLDRFDVEAEEKIEVTGRYLGDPQDPDTEVPARLSDRELSQEFKMLGAAPNRVDWNIREVETSTGSDLLTVYDFAVGIPLKTLVPEIFGAVSLGEASDRALARSPRSVPTSHSARIAGREKTKAQLDREIAVALRSRRR